MYNHYFYTFNNYYNRQTKRYNTKAEYDAMAIGIGNKTANFEFNDGVNTTTGMTALQWNALSAIPDYMLLCDTTEKNNILSRWFVIEAKLECGGNYTLYLRRDLVADFYDAVVNAPAFIEKATLNTMDPLIWNSENMTYNQIKKGEIEIKDKTQTPWIVGYYALKSQEEDASSGAVSVGIAEYDIDKEVADITKQTYYKYTEKPYYYLTKAELQVNAWRWINASRNKAQYTLFPQVSKPYFTEEIVDRKAEGIGGQAVGADQGPECLEYLVKQSQGYNLQQDFIDTVLTIDGITQTDLSTLQYLNHQIIKDQATNKIYKVNLTIGPVNNWSKPRADIANDSRYKTVFRNTELAIGVNDNVNSSIDFDESKNDEFYQYNISQQQILFSLDEITPTTGHFIHIDPDRRTLNDAPYSMFCIPYGEIDIIYPIENNATATFRTNKANALTIGAGLLANKSDFVYDVQILPFCPIERVRRIFQYNTIDMREFRDLIDYTTSAYGIKQVIFWADSSQGSIDISVEHMGAPGFTLEQFQELLNYWGYNYSDWDPIDAKVMSECSMYRLCSPNYASMFEYNISKNAGINNSNITDDPVVFRVDYGYKPFIPYIRVSPIFGGLYGTNYNDARGLILSGDFSITSTTDKWQQYQLQNKNYQLAFDRQIENMEINKKWGHIQDITNAVAGTVASATAGGHFGRSIGLGSPGAMVAGAIGGGVSSAIAGTADVIINQNLRNEAIDYAKDNFGFALGNIQALPHTINKVSTINPNFRYFPILEIYDATEDEKNALRQKVLYNGMTVGRINTISAYLQEEPTYIKAQLIRLEGIADDTHVLNELANEIMKGVYIAYVNTTISEPDNE